MPNKIKSRKLKSLWSKFDGSLRKGGLILSGVIVLLLIFVAGLLFWINQEAEKKAQASRPTIALVDEDLSGQFNGTDYNFGQSFVNLVSNDNKYNWQVVSRAVADRAFEEGSVQAVIYLPQNFTQNLLTLQAIDPQKAQVDYKVQNSQGELTNNLLQNKIVDELYDFNSSIVKMYYASVAGSVASAQTNMGNVISSQGSILSSLNSNVYGPFVTTNTAYSSVISVANSLKSQNESWIQAQNSFTNSVTNLLNANSSTMEAQLPMLADYFDTQKAITDINLINANRGIDNQATVDEGVYHTQYKTAYDKAVQAIQKFNATDASGNDTDFYVNLRSQINSYNTLVSEVRDDIGTQISSLTDKQATLLALEKQLYSQFFGQSVNPTPGFTDFTYLSNGDFGANNARQALANLISTSFGKNDNITNTPYPNMIGSLLSQISIDPSQYDALFTALVSNESLTATQKQKYIDELGVLSNYATSNKLSTVSTLNLKDAPTGNATDQTFTKQLKITVPAGKSYVLQLNASNGIGNNNVSISSATDQNGRAIAAGNLNWITLDNSKVIATDGNGNTTSTPATSLMTYTINYRVDLGQATSGTVNASWNNESGGFNSSVDTFGLLPADSVSEYAGGKQFGYITTLLNDIDTASSLIAFLYGRPGATYSDMKGVTDFQGTSNAKSIYNMYGNLDKTQIASRLSPDDVNHFRDLGSDNIKTVTDTLTSLQSTITSLNADRSQLTTHLPSDYFGQIADNLSAWYTQTMALLNAQYQSWTTNQPNVLQEKPWQQYQQGAMSLYYDKANSDSVYSTISGMVATTSKQSKDTAASAQIIKSNADQFSQMVDTVTQTQDVAKKVLDNTNSLLNAGNGELKNNQGYFGNFQSVLSNTRTNGVNLNNIFDFFSNPLQAQNVSPQSGLIAKSFDWRLLLIFSAGLLLGILGKTWIRRRPKTEKDK